LARAILIWVALTAALAVPLTIAAASPLLAWRDPIYIAGGFAGFSSCSLCWPEDIFPACLRDADDGCISGSERDW
jgi:hypothetical protein